MSNKIMEKKQKYGCIIELLLIICVLFLLIFILTPRFWEPGPESWKQWAAARVLRDTGGFPVFSLGPLYVVYLQLFSFFDYPLSIYFEYILTHLFASLAIFFLLQKFMRKSYALLLTAAWIPHLAIIEPGGAIMGVGFLSLYLTPGTNRLRNEGGLPSALLAAAFCHTVYVPFLGGHIIGKLIGKWKNKTPLFKTTSSKKIKVAYLFATIGLAVILLLTILSPSTRFDHNHMLMDPTYSPVPLNNPFNLAFFQFGNNRYIKSTYPEPEWIYKDWYFTNEEAFGGATSIQQALLNKPITVIKNTIMNMGLGIQMPSYFFAGKYLGPLGIIFWVFLFIGLFGLIRSLKTNNLYPQIFSVLFGFTTTFTVLAMTSFHIRYIATLLPLMLLILYHVPQGANQINSLFLKRFLFFKNTIKKKSLSILGIICISLGIFSNEWVLSYFILPYKDFSFTIKLQVWLFNLVLVILGATLILFQERIIKYLEEKRLNKEKEINKNKKRAFEKTVKIIKIIILISIVLLLITAPFPLGKIEHIKTVFNNKGFLSEAQPFSMVSNYQEIIKELDKDTKVLALEHHWVQAFTKVKVGNVFQIWSLPPFIDQSGEVQKKLCDLDVILVSSELSKECSSLGTQSYLRYSLHVKPFLKSDCAKKFQKKEIAGYGAVYIKKIN